MYQCEECGQVFDEAKPMIEKHTEIPPPNEEVFYVCPYCHSSNYHESVQCSQCEDYIDKSLRTQYVEAKNGDVVCNNCLHDYFEERYGA